MCPLARNKLETLRPNVKMFDTVRRVSIGNSVIQKFSTIVSHYLLHFVGSTRLISAICLSAQSMYSCKCLLRKDLEFDVKKYFVNMLVSICYY